MKSKLIIILIVGCLLTGCGQNKENTKREILRNVSNYQKVYSNKVELIKLYKPQAKTEVLLEENSNSQADIAEIFRFKMDNDLKKLIGKTMKTTFDEDNIDKAYYKSLKDLRLFFTFYNRRKSLV